MLAFTNFSGGLRSEEVFSSRINVILNMIILNSWYITTLNILLDTIFPFNFLLFSGPFHKET